jgi:hypothetical protein
MIHSCSDPGLFLEVTSKPQQQPFFLPEQQQLDYCPWNSPPWALYITCHVCLCKKGAWSRTLTMAFLPMGPILIQCNAQVTGANQSCFPCHSKQHYPARTDLESLSLLTTLTALWPWSTTAIQPLFSTSSQTSASSTNFSWILSQLLAKARNLLCQTGHSLISKKQITDGKMFIQQWEKFQWRFKNINSLSKHVRRKRILF